MSTTHEVGLSATEIAGLWASYINDSIIVCMSKHLVKYIEDKEVKPLLDDTLRIANGEMEQIRTIFNQEKFPIPKGFTDEDVDLTAPPLFFDLFPLSYVYAMNRLNMMSYSMYVASTAREDIRMFFTNCLVSATDIFNKSVNLMLAKGIYDRPAFIPYPEHTSYIKKKEAFLSKWFESSRPLNVIEISDIFFNIERNYFGIILLTGFIQVVRDEEIKKYLIQGKELSQQQIKFLNELLIEEDLLGTIMVNTEVTSSNSPPFSDRLILSIIQMLNASGIMLTGHGIAASTRVDLTAEFSKNMMKIIKYGKDGMDMLIAREWMEEIPHAPDRKAIAMH